MKFRILDLFCGAGGFSFGIEKNNNFQTVIALDFDKNATLTFSKNFQHSTVICDDITNIDVINKTIDLAKKNNINMIIGGPPCQGFSLKGKRMGLEDPRNFLFLEYIKFVEELKPEIFIIENVKNLLNESNGYFIKEIEKRFLNLNYHLTIGYLNAKDYGVPQNRQRAFIIGSLSRKINFPIQNNNQTITVRDAISDLAYLESSQGSEVSSYLNPPHSLYQQKLRGEYLYNHIATSHSKIALDKLKLIPPEGDKTHLPQSLYGNQKFKTTWSRLKWDDISPTIDTRFDTPSNGRNSHPFLNRSITPREAARIQSFDDSFRFYGTKTSICRQIGNAVPPLLAKAIADQISKQYGNTIEDKDLNDDREK